MNDYLIVSDIHLGDDKCQTDKILYILKKYPSKKIIIAGDLFDSHHLSRLRKSHWRVLSRLRKLSKKRKIIYLIGNHCFLKAEFMSILLGFDCRDEYVIENKKQKILVVHGDIFDLYFTKYRWITNLVVRFYYLLRKTLFAEPVFNLFKHHTNNFVKKSGQIRQNAFQYLIRNGYDRVIYGHSHVSGMDEHCVNMGSFCDNDCSFVLIKKGQVQLIKI